MRLGEAVGSPWVRAIRAQVLDNEATRNGPARTGLVVATRGTRCGRPEPGGSEIAGLSGVVPTMKPDEFQHLLNNVEFH